MTEEEKKKLEEEKKSNVEKSQLEQIEKMKAKMDKMVDPEEYEKLQKEYKKLLDDYVNKRPEPKKEEKKQRPVQDVAKELNGIKNSDITNRDYIKTALEYRDSHIKQTGKDPFTDFGEGGPSEPNEQTNKVAKVLKTLLNENETPTSFRIALNEVLKDDPKLMSKLRKRA